MKQWFSGVSGLAIAIGLACVPAASRATAAATDGAAAATASDTPADIDQVVVIGTRRSDVTALSGVAPVDVVGSQALTGTGSENLISSLRTMLPEVSFSETGGQIGARQPKAVALDGLDPDETLVLVNGIRRNLSPRIASGTEWGRGNQPVDLSDIPQNAIARVEVLQDGASAQYGSDAIAGVVNIILRGNEPGGDITVTSGLYYGGDGQRGDVNGWYTVPIGDKGFVNVAVDVQVTSQSYRNYTNDQQFYFAINNTTGLPCGPINSSGQPTAAQPNCHLDPREALVDRRQPSYGDVPTKKAVSSLNGQYRLTDKLTAYAFGTWDYRQATTQGVVLPDSDSNVRAIFPNGIGVNGTGYSLGDFVFHTVDGAVGLRYDAGALGHFDLSTEFGQGYNSLDNHRTENATFGLATPTSFYDGEYISKQSSTELAYVNDLATPVFAKPATLSAGAGYVWEYYGIRAGDPYSYTDGGAPILDGPDAGKHPPLPSGISPADAGNYSRSSYNAYIGVEQKLTDQLQLNLAGRAEHYSDFGNALTGKAAGRYDPTHWLGLRASVSTGFKAPTMGQIGYSSHSTAFVYPKTGLAYSAATLWLPVSNPIAIDMGAQPLKPEKSVNYSAGFVLRPTSKASVTVDFYRIDISDQILPIDAITGSFLTSELTKLGVANASAISSLRYFANAISDRTQGINIVGRDSWDFGWLGQLSGTVALNYNNVAVTKVNPNPSVLPSTVTIAGPVTIGYVEHWAPDSKWVATLTYTKGPWEVFLTETRYGRWDFVSPQAALDQTFGFQWVTNLAITRTVMKNVRLTFGANNLFNTYPTEAILADTYSNANKCDLQAQEGCQGGYWYGRLDYRF